LVYLAEGGTTDVDLSDAKGSLTVKWYNPRIGGALLDGTIKTVQAGKKVSIGKAPTESGEDWVVLIRK